MLRISIIPVHGVLQAIVASVTVAVVVVHDAYAGAVPHAVGVPRLHALPDLEDPAASRRRPRSVLVVRLLPVQPDIICDRQRMLGNLRQNHERFLDACRY